MSEPRYYVIVDGQKLGPFDKRTITGMRVKKTLTNEHEVRDENGRITTVFDVVGASTNSSQFQVSSPLSSGVMYPRFEVRFLKPPAQPYGDEPFVGQGELRVQPDVLRVAGQVKQGFFSKHRDHRVKVPREHITLAKRIANVVAVEATKLSDWPQRGFFSFEFASDHEAQAFCACLETPTSATSNIVPDVEI